MAKKGMFGWLGFGKNKQQDNEKQQQQDDAATATELAAAEQADAQRIEAQRIAGEHAEAQRIATEQADAQRIAAEQAEAQRIAAEQAEAQRIAAEQADAQRIAAEQAEAQRIAAEQAEAQRIATEQADAQRIAAEQAEVQRIAAEQAEAQRIAAEQAEAQRIAAEQAEAQRIAAEQAEAQRVAAEQVEAQRIAAEQAEAQRIATEQPKKSGFFTRLKEGLKRTKQNFGGGLLSLFSGKKIDDDLFEELEEQLLIADVGVDTTLKIIDSLTKGANRKQLKDGEALYQLLKQEMSDIIEPVSIPLDIEKSDGPYVILMVGVNGVGKTTTIGKLAKQFQSQGKKVALAAGDTFRAAAVEQLQVWGERNDISVIAQHTGADSASVIFDAVQAAKARNVDVLIADTAGRLQNKAHLMDELKKVVRVMRKLDETAPHEIMLTLDAGTGQNAMSQVALFNEAVGITGLTLTKLDGTAKGGVVFSLADKYSIPIRYIGVGEGIDDLRQFNSREFIDALFDNDQEQ